MSSRIEEHKFFGFDLSQGAVASKGTQCLATQRCPPGAQPSACGHLTWPLWVQRTSTGQSLECRAYRGHRGGWAGAAGCPWPWVAAGGAGGAPAGDLWLMTAQPPPHRASCLTPRLLSCFPSPAPPQLIPAQAAGSPGVIGAGFKECGACSNKNLVPPKAQQRTLWVLEPLVG